MKLTVENATPPAEPPSNSERLLKHLKEDALSTRLVQAHQVSGGAPTTLKDVIKDRLEQVRQSLVSKD
jgi:hypothetical protein